ncbi:HCP-like protein [Rhizophagus irregularis]|nr:HCP-like protein [Rhizophagus irregularis]
MESNSNNNIDKQIQWFKDGITEGYINYYEYNEFKNTKVIGCGAFSNVRQATWGDSNTVVALKSFSNNSLIMKEIINEIKLLHRVSFHTNIIKFFGITERKNNEDNIDSNYLLILECADSGTLGNYLKDNFDRLDWNMKLQFAIQIADAVSYVYSVGVLLWEISSGEKPFKSYDKFYLRFKLMLEILNGKRESPIPNTPIDYINIYKKCWQNNPDDRPDIQKVFSDLKSIKLKANKIKTFELYKEAAEKGVIEAINNLGNCYFDGIGTEKNENKAFELYKEAVEKGDINAINNLGYCYSDGIGTEKDETKAFELHKEAAEKGSTISAINNLGDCYFDGTGTEKDETKAFELYKKAAEKAEKGYFDSMNDLGYCYQHGIGTKKDEIKAFELYKKAAENDHITSMYNLGEFEKGHIYSLYDLGCCYENGIGTEKDEIKACELYEKYENKL